jgi:hypothetical protein
MQLLLEAQYVKFALQAVPSQGRPQEAASKFEVVDVTLCDALCHDVEVRVHFSNPERGERRTQSLGFALQKTRRQQLMSRFPPGGGFIVLETSLVPKALHRALADRLPS